MSQLGPQQSAHQGASIAAPQTPPPERLLRLPEALTQTGLRRTQFLGLVAKGEAPRPVKVGKSSLWVERELQQFIRDRMNARLIRQGFA